MNNIKRVAATALATLALVTGAQAQQQSSATLTRRSTGTERVRPGRKAADDARAPQVTDRMQRHYDDAGKSVTDADRQWQRIIYRHIDLDKDQNAALYFPEDLVDGQENLFRIIMRLLADGQLTAYEYLDGREVFNEANEVKVGDMLDRFHIVYTPAKGSTRNFPRYTIAEADVPTNEVLSYYIIERWEYDTRHNRMRTVVDAICPVLHRSGDFGGEAVKYPMFWVKYADLRPSLANQTIFVNDDNNLPTCTYDDFFAQNMYQGDIYKTRNLKNRSMMQLYSDPDQLKRAQDSIQARLDKFEEKLWVPDREQVIAASKKTAKVEEKVEAPADQGAAEERPARRSTRRSTKKAPKQTTVTEQKAKPASFATRSVRRRR